MRQKSSYPLSCGKDFLSIKRAKIMVGPSQFGSWSTS